MADPTVLTLVLNYRTAELTVQAAETALREREGVAGEVMIVDNDSRDGSLEYITRAAAEKGWDATGRLQVLSSGHNGGFGAGNNFGMRAGLSTGEAPDYVFLLNSDAWVEPGAIRVLVDFLEAHPDAGMAGSVVHGPDGEPHNTAFRVPTIASEFEGSARTGVFTRLFRNSVVPMGFPEGNAEVDWAAGAAIMMRRTMLDRIGLFDETYFLYFDETDLCLRAKRAGWKIWYVPESRVTHIGSVSTGMRTWQRTPQYWFDSRLHYFRKNYSGAYAAAATLACIAGQGVYSLRRLISNKPQRDPDRFVRDLIQHSLRALVAPRTGSGGESRRGAIID